MILCFILSHSKCCHDKIIRNGFDNPTQHRFAFTYSSLQSSECRKNAWDYNLSSRAFIPLQVGKGRASKPFSFSWIVCEMHLRCEWMFCGFAWSNFSSIMSIELVGSTFSNFSPSLPFALCLFPSSSLTDCILVLNFYLINCIFIVVFIVLISLLRYVINWFSTYCVFWYSHY